MRLRRPRGLDHEADLVMVAGLSGVHPAQIETYTLLVVNTAGEGWIVTPDCCAAHAWAETVCTFGPLLGSLPPCSGDGG